jgi:hypothetical protein
MGALTRTVIDTILDVVLFEPEIPPNTENIIRLCANTGFGLHLNHLLGFELDEKGPVCPSPSSEWSKGHDFPAGLFHVVDRFNWRCHAYCLLGNPYHLLIESPLTTLSLRHAAAQFPLHASFKDSSQKGQDGVLITDWGFPPPLSHAEQSPGWSCRVPGVGVLGTDPSPQAQDDDLVPEKDGVMAWLYTLRHFGSAFMACQFRREYPGAL